MPLANLNAWILLASVIALQGCAHSTDSMRARVIDAETRQPVAGVNVSAKWNVNYHLFLHGTGRQTIEIVEGVTDADGWVELPGWGARMLPAGVPVRATMAPGAPFIEFFKSGYRYQLVANPDGSSYRKSEWDGKTVELVRFAGTRAQYAEQPWGYYLNHTHMPCAFKKTPRMLIAFEREAQALDREGLRHDFKRLGKLESIYTKDNCGSVKEFFAPYLQSEPPGFYKQNLE